VAFVGASGCGKTTLLKLILGLIQPTKGTITIGGADINTLPPEKYRALFGTVMQADSLLAGSILENITMYATNYDENAVIKACKHACIWDDISQLRMGLHSLVGDMGDNLSGGQLQRLFLARALYKQPRILCLDESSSHLDIENESLINQNLSDLKITKVIVAHRKESINSANRIIRLK
jgi:ATP-binding cassette subfamily B protein RaxB